MKKTACVLCIMAILLTAGCGQSAPSSSNDKQSSINSTVQTPTDSVPREQTQLAVGNISRRPENGASFMAQWQNSKTLDELLTPDEIGTIELRCADVSAADFSKAGELLLNASFDDQTKWPAEMPPDFDMEKLVESGKDPGLRVRELHAQGITGKGVGIAIIDQTLLVDHQEYAGRLRLYQEYHSMAQDTAAMHGAAVASIALGDTVGVAPEALLYYIADDLGSGTTDENFVRDMSYYAQDIDRFIALNETLPADEKIRVISISSGYTPDVAGADKMDEAIARARAAGIAVVWISDRDPLMKNFAGMNRTPYGDPNDIDARLPGRFMEKNIYSGEYSFTDAVLVPMDRRTTAACTAPDEYAYYVNGGSSWTRPYIAGLYALACQVKPDVTFEEFTEAALATAHPVSITRDGKAYIYGKVADPVAILESLTGHKWPFQADILK